MTENRQSLRVSFEELAAIANSEPGTVSVEAQIASENSGAKIYGNINASQDVPASAQEKGSILLQGWFYLGVAGTIGSLAGWAITEPGFVDGLSKGSHWGNLFMVPVLVTLMCVCFAVAESIIERSTRKALVRAGLALPLGMALGFFISNLANLFYGIGLAMCRWAGVISFHSPAAWIARGAAWMVLGVAGGVSYGIIGQSMKKTGYGALGGALGALIGGTIFDPISFATHGGATSRAIGFGLLGMATGIAIGLVESALKDRWLHVTAGPLAGKQFILYKPRTVIGSSQGCDIYLFKDPDILPLHSELEMKGSKIYLIASGPVYISGQPLRGIRVLDTGAIIQIGRYAFRYQEKQRG